MKDNLPEEGFPLHTNASPLFCRAVPIPSSPAKQKKFKISSSSSSLRAQKSNKHQLHRQDHDRQMALLYFGAMALWEALGADLWYEVLLQTCELE